MSLYAWRPAKNCRASLSPAHSSTHRTTLILFFCLAAALHASAELTITANLPVGTVNVAYDGSLTASGGTAPYTYSAPGLPKGLTCNSTTGAITGKPTTAGSTTFTAHVKDSTGKLGAATFTITINNPPISVTVAPKTETLPSGGSQEFIATVLYTTDTAVPWSTSAGTIDANGNFYAPKVTTNTIVTITATSVADTTKS